MKSLYPTYLLPSIPKHSTTQPLLHPPFPLEILAKKLIPIHPSLKTLSCQQNKQISKPKNHHLPFLFLDYHLPFRFLLYYHHILFFYHHLNPSLFKLSKIQFFNNSKSKITYDITNCLFSLHLLNLHPSTFSFASVFPQPPPPLPPTKPTHLLPIS